MRFVFVTTEDQSPTLRIRANDAGDDAGGDGSLSEAMHSLKGAFSETVYIYGTAIETGLRESLLKSSPKELPPRVLSLGLGLGYVEILSAAYFCRFSASNSGGESFEALPELRDWFTAWALGHVQDLPEEFHRTYDSILSRSALEVGVHEAEVREFLRVMIRDGHWRIRESLTNETQFDRNFGVICFDAFSSKTSPDLWTESFLGDFIQRACAPQCVLSTYACTGALKRSLRSAGFELKIREGFASKRDSTFATRGL